MRRLTAYLLLIAGFAGCGSGDVSSQPRPGSQTVSFRVEGMTCAESCAPTVQKILARQPGVEKAVVDYETKQATCTIDPKSFDVDAAIAELADQDFIATARE